MPRLLPRPSASLLVVLGTGCGAASELGPNPKADWVLTTLHANGNVYEVDPETAALTTLGQLDLSDADESFNPPSADVREDGLGILAGNKPEPAVFEFDVCEGTAQRIGATGGGPSGALSFGESGSLFLIDQEDDALKRVEPNTGLAIKVGRLGFDIGYAGLAYDRNEDRLLGIDADGPSVFTINPKTGRTKHLSDLTDGDWRAVGVEFDAERDLMLVSDGPNLWEVVPDSGDMHFVGEFVDLDYVNDLTFVPPCD